MQAFPPRLMHRQCSNWELSCKLFTYDRYLSGRFEGLPLDDAILSEAYRSYIQGYLVTQIDLR